VELAPVLRILLLIKFIFNNPFHQTICFILFTKLKMDMYVYICTVANDMVLARRIHSLASAEVGSAVVG
jgi:hypothetical protein